ncbi:ribokinase [Streptomyces sp. PT12]|nr:ribokinase [Streptomyces sp. PT12]
MSGGRPGEGGRALVVVGSINRDLTLRVPHRPDGGETVLGTEATFAPGGKGANQAMAAARAGARVRFVGSAGPDGAPFVRALGDGGVDVSAVEITGSTTGLAVVLVTTDGQNSIVVAPGANELLTAEQVERVVAAEVAAAEERDGAAPVVLLQCEIPIGAVVDGVRTAAARGARVVLNLAPYAPLPGDVLAVCDPLVVNESEAGQALGRRVATGADAADAAIDLARRARSAVVTRGAGGAVVARAGDVTVVPGLTVPVVDTTGAGDAFVGTLAARLAADDDLMAAVRAGNAAGARAVGHRGAQPPNANGPTTLEER